MHRQQSKRVGRPTIGAIDDQLSLSLAGGEIRPLWSVVLHVWQVRHDGAFLNLALLIRALCHLQIGLISSLRPRESQSKERHISILKKSSKLANWT